jgi:hypothetical protein
MYNYRGIVQNIVMVGDGEYRVTFRAYDEQDMEACFWENEDVPFTLYSMIARRRDNNYSVIPEGALADCISVLRDNESVATLEWEEIEKWKIGALANDLALSLAENGLFTPCSPD